MPDYVNVRRTPREWISWRLALLFWALKSDRIGNHFEDVAMCGKGWFGWPKCPGCGGSVTDNWFDRSVCPEPCGAMHTRCSGCGYALDACGNDEGWSH